jgi:hypothetical protein
MNKHLTIFYYERDGDAAKAAAAKIRAGKTAAMLRDVNGFDDVAEPCDRVITMPCVGASAKMRLQNAYGAERVQFLDQGSALPPPPPPLAPPPVDPLASLPANWRRMSTIELKSIAAALTGRTVENAEQAREIIQQAVDAKG